MEDIIPKGVYNMKTRNVIIKENAKTYQSNTKKTKTELLSELTKILPLNRQYLAYLLRNSGRVIYRKGNQRVICDTSQDLLSRRGRKRLYTEKNKTFFKVYLEGLWFCIL